MNASSLVRTLLYLAVLGLIVLYASRLAGRVGAKASAGVPGI